MAIGAREWNGTEMCALMGWAPPDPRTSRLTPDPSGCT